MVSPCMCALCRSNVEDPYLQLGDSEDESEVEDMTFRDTDLVILGARNEDDVSHLEVRRGVASSCLWRCRPSSSALPKHDLPLSSPALLDCPSIRSSVRSSALRDCYTISRADATQRWRRDVFRRAQKTCWSMQVWVYEEADEETEDNLYVHHDVIVPYFPLSVAWLDLDPTGEQWGALCNRNPHASASVRSWVVGAWKSCISNGLLPGEPQLPDYDAGSWKQPAAGACALQHPLAATDWRFCFLSCLGFGLLLISWQAVKACSRLRPQRTLYCPEVRPDPSWAGSRPFANMAAVGSYGTGIEIWDLDVIDSVEPAAVLGGPVAGAGGAVPKQKKKKGAKQVTHWKILVVPAQLVICQVRNGCSWHDDHSLMGLHQRGFAYSIDAPPMHPNACARHAYKWCPCRQSRRWRKAATRRQCWVWPGTGNSGMCWPAHRPTRPQRWWGSKHIGLVCSTTHRLHPEPFVKCYIVCCWQTGPPGVAPVVVAALTCLRAMCAIVQVWDLATGSCAHTLTHHEDKVQAVGWNPAQPSVLLSGGFDQRACLVRWPERGAASSLKCMPPALPPEADLWKALMRCCRWVHTSCRRRVRCYAVLSSPCPAWDCWPLGLRGLRDAHVLPLLPIAADTVWGLHTAQADVRTPDGQALSWATGADVEALAWLPDQPTQFLVSTEDGLVAAFDARKGSGAHAWWSRLAQIAPRHCHVPRAASQGLHVQTSKPFSSNAIPLITEDTLVARRVRPAVEVVSARQAGLRPQSLPSSPVVAGHSLHRQDGALKYNKMSRQSLRRLQ